MALSVLAATTTQTPQATTGLNFWMLLVVGLAIMIFGNFVGRFISLRMHKVLNRKAYFAITIPFMVIFVLVVWLFGARMTVTGQYVLFGVFIFAFSIMGGFVEPPPAPQQSSGKKSSDKQNPAIRTGKTVEGKGKDVEEKSPVDDKTEH